MTRQTLARTLTYLGAIPFIGLSFYIYSGMTVVMSQATAFKLFVTYAAVILTFLAGIHWGVALNPKHKASQTLFVSSNVMALTAWLSLNLSKTSQTLLLLLIGFVVQLIIDTVLYRKHWLREWFFKLRAIASAIVIGSLLLVYYHLL